MQFNPTALERKLAHLDAILREPQLLERVLARFCQGRPVSCSAVRRPWEPGGGSSLFLVRAGEDCRFLKVKSVEVTVESRLECEAAFSGVPSLRNEFEMLQRVKDTGGNTPQQFEYFEEAGYGFLFLEPLESFEAVAPKLEADELVQAYAELVELLRVLHARGLAHTDVHELNIMFRGRTPVLVDFEEARQIRQPVPFELSLDFVGENQFGNVGQMPDGPGRVPGLTCARRLREVFKRLIRNRLDSLIKRCSFDSACPFLAALDHGKDDRIYQSINVDGLKVAGQRPVSDPRIEQLLTVIRGHFGRPVTHLDIGSNLGRFNLDLSRDRLVECSIGAEAFDDYVRLSRVLAFLSDNDRAKFYTAECGKDSLADLLAGRRVDVVTIYSVYHHIRNKPAFVADLKRLAPELIIFEMAVQPECYGGRSWQEELTGIREQLGLSEPQVIGYSADYQRPIVVLRKPPTAVVEESEPLPERTLVSVVLPTYNQVEFLPQIVQSLLAQTLKDFELIIVNDGSTDGTRKYLETVRDGRVRVIHQANAKLPNALNAGFAVAGGRYLTWVSSDNYCSPVFLEYLVAALEANPSAGLAISGFAWIDESGSITGVHRNQDVSLPSLLRSNPGIASFLYRRSIAHAVGQYDPGLEGAEDWDMWLRIAERHPVVVMPDVLYYYRLHDRSMTRRIPERVSLAGQRVFQRASDRRGGLFDLDELYPAIAECSDRAAAETEACFDFGTRMLTAPFVPPGTAVTFLTKAFESRSCAEFLVNLILAFAKAGQWEDAQVCLSHAHGLAKTNLRRMLPTIQQAVEQRNAAKALAAGVFVLQPGTSELLAITEKRARVYCHPALAHDVEAECHAGAPPPRSARAACAGQERDAVGKADDAYARGDLNGARQHLQTAASACPADCSIQAALGSICFQLGDHNEALLCFKRATQLRPKDPVLQVQTALVAQSLEDAELFLVSLAEALRLDPACRPARRLLADSLVKTGNLAAAARQYLMLAEQDPDDVPVLLALADCFAQGNQWEAAARVFEAALAANPDSEPAREGLAVAKRLGSQSAHKGVNGSPQNQLIISPTPKSAGAGRNPSSAHHGAPLVSVIVPTYNRPDGLEEALQSILCQSLQDFEILVINDAGQDVLRVIESIPAKQPIRYLRHDKNKGLAAARNTGIRAAKGEYIAYLDDDDIFFPDHLQVLAEALKARPETDVVYSDAWRAHQVSKHGSYRTVRRDLPYSFDFDRERMLRENFIPVLCFMHKRSCWEAVGGFDESLPVLEDWDLWIRMSRQFRFYHIPRVTSEFRWRTDGSTMTIERSGRFPAARQAIANKIGRMLALEASPLPQKPAVLVSVIVLARNQLQHTSACLESLGTHCPPDTEFIVVDNGSNDATAQFLEEFSARDARLKVIRNVKNHGFPLGNNQGLAIANGRFIVLLNNDTIVTERWLEGMLQVFRQHPDVGIVGPMTNFAAGPQLTGDPLYRGVEHLAEYATNWRTAHAAQSRETCRVIGFCLMARREVIDRIGGLDPVFGTGNFEDDDFCLRAVFSGFKIRIAQEVFIHHTGSRTFQGERIDYSQAMRRNWGIFKAKWRLPAAAPIEKGYGPMTLPRGLALKVALPELNQSHESLSRGRLWKELSSAGASPRSEARPPACAGHGDLHAAQLALRGERLPEAWQLARQCVSLRPYHPEGLILLGEIARAAGDYSAARACGQKARELAPNWKTAKKFVKNCPKGGKRPAWLELPKDLAGEDKLLNPRLSVCLVVKDEEKFIAQCLRSVEDIAHQIVLIDTGSTDRTVDIAKQHGAEVYHFAWCDDFSAARNSALHHATGDWILILDADEELPSDSREQLKKHMAEANVMAWRLPLLNTNQKDADVCYVPRLFRNAPGLFFKGRVHEQIYPMVDAVRFKFGLDNRLGEALLLHHGYDEQVMRDKRKIERNLRLLELAIQEQPGEPNLLMNLGLELTRSGREAEGLERYREAYRAMSALPSSGLLPELKQTLLIQFCSRLHAAKLLEEVVEVLHSPLAKIHGGLTASDHLSLGVAHFELGQYREAVEQMRQCIAKRNQPSLTQINTSIHTAGPFHFMGVALAKSGDHAGAEKAFQDGLKEKSGVERVRADYASFLVEQKRPVEALQQLHAIIGTQPENRGAWILGGQVALSQPEFLEFANDWTAEALKHLPGDAAIQSLRAEALLLSGQVDDSAELWRKVVEAQRHPRSLAALIMCEALRGGVEHRPVDQQESLATSKAFFDWYRKCLNYNLKEVVAGLNDRVEALREALPEAARILTTALDEAARPEAAEETQTVCLAR